METHGGIGEEEEEGAFQRCLDEGGRWNTSVLSLKMQIVAALAARLTVIVCVCVCVGILEDPVDTARTHKHCTGMLATRVGVCSVVCHVRRHREERQSRLPLFRRLRSLQRPLVDVVRGACKSIQVYSHTLDFLCVKKGTKKTETKGSST